MRASEQRHPEHSTEIKARKHSDRLRDVALLNRHCRLELVQKESEDRLTGWKGPKFTTEVDVMN